VAASDVVKILQKHGMPRLASGTDVVLLDHSLLSLVHAYNISKRVARTMRHNQLLYAGMNGVQLVLTSTRMASPLVAPILVNSSLLMRIHDAQRLRVWRDVLAEWPDSRTVKEVVQDGSN
jgi:cation transport ATPase